jgi:Ca-activated chloride channel family protein
MKKIFVLMVLLSIISGILAQGKTGAHALTGIVKDSDGKALSGVTISVVQALKTVAEVTSGKDGRFAVENLKKGEYELHVSHPGYGVLVKKVSYTPGEKTEYELILTFIVSENLGSVELDVGAYQAALEQMGSIKSQTIPQVNVSHDRAGSDDQPMSFLPYGSVGHSEGVFIPPVRQPHAPWNTEEYSSLTRNIFHSPLTEPLSTFSIDVDTAFYSQLRSMINSRRLPSPNSVRIEELINYFDYDYPEPAKGKDFTVFTELGKNPWNEERQLMHIGIKGRKIDMRDAPPSNLVFLIDVSGSMRDHNKLPLVKESMKLLAKQMRPQDRIAIAVYAGSAGLVLPSADGNQSRDIIAALDRLQAGGSTAGGAGIQLAYRTAESNFIKNGNNRVILCTDGDFNVGVSSTADLTKMIEEYRTKGIFLSILGFGMGNYKDNRMEELSNKGNGNYAYIDSIREAKKVLVDQMAGTLYTIAKDVKLQIEFNPAYVKAYRLIGYENRMLNTEDFIDDTKDAGELGAGHTVTAIYEIIPRGSDEKIADVDDLKYQRTTISGKGFSELATVKLRYKKPDKDVSTPLDVSVHSNPLTPDKCSDNFNWSAAVAGFGMLLSDGAELGDLNWKIVQNLARKSIGEDREGWRSEFIQMINAVAELGRNHKGRPRTESDYYE